MHRFSVARCCCAVAPITLPCSGPHTFFEPGPIDNFPVNLMSYGPVQPILGWLTMTGEITMNSWTFSTFGNKGWFEYTINVAGVVMGFKVETSGFGGAPEKLYVLASGGWFFLGDDIMSPGDKCELIHTHIPPDQYEHKLIVGGVEQHTETAGAVDRYKCNAQGTFYSQTDFQSPPQVQYQDVLLEYAVPP